MRRLFWLGIGLAIGALAFRKLNRVAQKMTPGGLAQSIGSALADLSEALRDFAADVRQGMHEQEAALREGAGLDAGSADPGRHATAAPLGRTAGQ
jgi:hypothetical protein